MEMEVVVVSSNEAKQIRLKDSGYCMKCVKAKAKALLPGLIHCYMQEQLWHTECQGNAAHFVAFSQSSKFWQPVTGQLCKRSMLL